jgi:hypothetical protein
MPIKFIGKNHIRGVIFSSKLEMASGCEVTLIGCHILHGVSIGARASLQMIGCRLECLDGANIRVGKAASLVADDTQFHGGNETVLGPDRIIDCAQCSKLVCTNCSFDGRASDAIFVKTGTTLSDYGGEDNSMDVLRVDSCCFVCSPQYDVSPRSDFNNRAFALRGFEPPHSIHFENNVRSSAMHRVFHHSWFLTIHCLLHFLHLLFLYSGHYRHAALHQHVCLSQVSHDAREYVHRRYFFHPRKQSDAGY